MQVITVSPATIGLTTLPQEKVHFSGQEDDFPVFLEQFEAMVQAMGLSDCLMDRIKTTPQADWREREEADLAKLQYMV